MEMSGYRRIQGNCQFVNESIVFKSSFIHGPTGEVVGNTEEVGIRSLFIESLQGLQHLCNRGV